MAGETGWLYRRLVSGGGFAGLGAYDCAAEVAAKPSGYVFGGSRIQYTANVYHHLGQAFQNRDAAVQSAVESLGNLYNVSVRNDMAFIQITAYNVTVTATSRIDRNNISDIQGDIRQQMNSLGFTVNTDSIALASSPSVAQICGGTHPSTGVTPLPGSNPLAGFSFGDLVSKYGYVPLVVGGLVVLMVLRRR